ncbi:MAG TPA: YbaK/EbsC family protein [Candidatus Nanoarchaeia archaeon]|nr:YbaK/EbsC family protein [Candidatus Nanoarchaeia archaeon]
MEKIELNINNLDIVPEEYQENVRKVLDKIISNSIDAKLLAHPENPVTSLQSHLDLYGGNAENVMKCLCFVSNSKPLIVVASGEIKIDMKKLTSVSGMKDIRMANLDELKSLFGRNPGGVDPLTISENIPAYIDTKFLDKEFVVGSGGCSIVGLKLCPKEILKAREFVVVDLAK